MKKAFDCVQMMWDIRTELSRRYGGKPELEKEELRRARQWFVARGARRRQSAVAEESLPYGE